MKRVLKKILIVILIVLILNNFLINSVQANIVDDLGGAIGGLFSGVVGLLTFLYRAPAVMIGFLVNKFMTTLAYAEGKAPAGTDTSFLTVFDVLFTNPEILRIDFFDLSNTTSLVGKFRLNVAAWYYIMRNIAAGILLVILVYVGIRMAISTIASDRAMYKRMLVDWCASLLLIFILNYIIIFTIEVNNAIVNAMKTTMKSHSELASVMSQFGWKGMTLWGGISSIVAAIIYIMLIWQTLALFFSYFNRMLKIAFLIIIAPLITLTYSVDKMGDGKAQALDAWLKEFVFTILIQPFHCAIYMSLIGTSINVLIGLGSFNKISETLGSGIIALVCITFTKEAEKIVRKIFAFKDDNQGTSLAAGAILAGAAISKAKNIGTGSVKFAHGAKNFFSDAGKSLGISNIRAEAIAAGKYLRGKNKDSDGNEKDYKTIRQEERERIYSKKAERMELREDKAIGMLLGNSEDDRKKAEAIRAEAVAAEIEKMKLDNNGKMTDKELEAVARVKVARRKRTLRNYGKNKFNNTKAGKFTNSALTAAKNGIDMLPLETMRELAKESTKSVGFFMGAGTLGVSGKLSNAAVTAHSTNKAVEQFTKNSVSSYSTDISDLLNSHSEVTSEEPSQNSIKTTDKEDTKRDSKKKVINKVLNNSQYYDLEGDTIPEHLKDLISEINKALEATGTEKIDETTIKNTIKNSKNPGSALDKLLSSSIFPESGNNQAFDDAKEKLVDYGVEYAVNKKFNDASEVGINSGTIMTSITRHRGAYDPDLIGRDQFVKESQKTLDSKKHAMELIEKPEDIYSLNCKPNETEVMEKVFGDKTITAEEIEKFAIEVDKYQKDRENMLLMQSNAYAQAQMYEQSSDIMRKLNEKSEQIERAKTVAIAQAICHIEKENLDRINKLVKKTTKDLENLLQNKTITNSADLEELKKALEALKM